MSITIKGIEIDQKETGDIVTFKDGEFKWENGTGLPGKVKSIEPAKQPKEIDYVTLDGKIQKCLYKLEGDTFSDCVTQNEGPRPKDFKSTKNNNVIVLVYKRVTLSEDKKYESRVGKYRIAFSGKPTLQDAKESGEDVQFAILKKGNNTFMVFYGNLPEERVKKLTPTQILDEGVKEMVNSTKVKVVSSNDITFGEDKLPGRDIVAGSNRNTIRIRMIISGKRMYQIGVSGPKDFATGMDADKFLDSFEIIK